MKNGGGTGISPFPPPSSPVYVPRTLAFRTAGLPALVAKTWELEDTILNETDQQLVCWREEFLKRKEVATFQREAALKE